MSLDPTACRLITNFPPAEGEHNMDADDVFEGIEEEEVSFVNNNNNNNNKSDNDNNTVCIIIDVNRMC